MQNLDAIRKEIDEIDADMSVLFSRRMDAAKKVAEYKNQNNIAVLDSAREAKVIEKNLARLKNPAYAKHYTSFLENIMALSRQYQADVLGKGIVAYQGAKGGFGHKVALALFPNAQTKIMPTFSSVFNVVQSGEAAFGVVPFENSTTGDVSGVLDLLYAHDCHIYAMYDLPATQNLLALQGATLKDIKTVFSHEQALAQSQRFLNSLSAKLVPFANTALAAKHVANSQNPSFAAIASADACKLYGLQMLAEDISTMPDNTTRFVIITKEKQTIGNQFSLLITVNNEVGSLAKVIKTIADNGFNMENIKSRPMPKRPWEYYFYIEILGKDNNEDTKKLMQELTEVCLSARMLGFYQKSF